MLGLHRVVDPHQDGLVLKVIREDPVATPTAAVIDSGTLSHNSVRDEVHGVICTMIKDETRYLAEWIQFHLLVGATKIVIYNDNSTVDISQMVQRFGDPVIVHEVQDLEALPKELLAPGLVHHGRQQWVMKHHCAPTYGGKGRGWLAVFDVDEFIFPCRNTGADLYSAFQQRLKDNSTVAVRLECVKFGFNDLNRTLHEGELLTEWSTRRAPYPTLEPDVTAWAWQNLTECAAQPLACRNVGSYKTVYKLDVAPAAQPAIHGPHSAAHAQHVNVEWDRHSGICCNHYALRSNEELVEKYTKGMSMHEYAPMLKPHPQQWYRLVHDKQIWQYLPALREALESISSLLPRDGAAQN